MLAPVKLAAIDDDTADSGTVTTNPLGRRVDNDIGAMIDRPDKVTASTERVVNLAWC